MLSNEDGLVPVSFLQRALRKSGLWKNDPRLAQSMTALQNLVSEADNEPGRELLLSKEGFKECVRDNIVLIRRAFTGDFILPEFSKFCSIVDDIYYACRAESEGKVSISNRAWSNFIDQHLNLVVIDDSLCPVVY